MPSHDISALRQRALDAFMVGVSAADPVKSLSQALTKNPLPRPKEGGGYIVVAVGKAACKMADCAIKHLPASATTTAVAVTNYENEELVAGCEVMGAAHPVPDERGLHAGRRVHEILSAATAKDIVVMLVSGGASALMPAPVSSIGLYHKIRVNDLLLAGGLDIYETNLVRQSLSELKGGGALKLAHPADVHSYILSDVLGDDLRVVGSGPSICQIGTPADARRLLIERGLFTKLPNLVREHLENAKSEKPCTFPENAHLIASNQTSLKEMAQAAEATLIEPALVGDVQDAAITVLNAVKEHKKSGPIALAFGGETTVTIRGKGKGGRNQEIALRFALAAQEANFDFPWCFLSGGTDGRDGPTDAAGGLTDNSTLARLQKAGIDVDAILLKNDSYAALAATGDLLMTGTTGTNVADLQLFLAQV